MEIYIITNLSNGKVYVGKTERTISSRWSKHLQALASGNKCALYAAIRKYGIENFSISSLSTHTSKEELESAEKDAINRLNSMCPKGYNMTPGGDGGGMYGHKHSPETIIKLKGQKRSEETRKRMSEAQKTSATLAERVKKMNDAMRSKRASGWKPSVNPPHTTDSIRKMRETKRSQHLVAWNRGIKMPTLNGNQHARGYKHTQEELEKISRASRGNKHAAGKPAWNRNSVPVPCVVCGKEMQVMRCKLTRKKTCSWECRSTWISAMTKGKPLYSGIHGAGVTFPRLITVQAN